MVPVGEKDFQVGTVDGGGEWTGVQDFCCMVTESRGRLWVLTGSGPVEHQYSQ